MPEVLRDLVVSLSLKTDNFSRNINSINRQIREAESAFRLAGAGIDNFGNTTAGMSSRLSMLQTNLGHQREIVGQWERALATANARLQESHARYTEYSGRLDKARQKHQALGDAIKDQEAYLQQIADAARQQVKVDAVVDKLITTNAETGETSLTVEGIIGYVTQYAEATTGADVSGLTPDNVTAMVAAYQELASGADVSTLKPSEIVAYVNKYLEDQGVDTTGLTPEAVTAFVLAYQEVEGGALTTALTPDDVTAMVVKYLEAEGVDVSALKPDQVEALVNKFSEATGCDMSALAQSLTGYISSYDNSGATVPSPQCKLSISGYDLSALNKVLANNPIKVDGILRLGEKYENPQDVLSDENAHFYYNGEEVPVNLVPAEKLTAETIIAYDTDGTLHVVITPEVGSG